MLTRAPRMRSALCSSAARCLSTTAARSAITPFKMPSMSPTMEEGKISSWKVSPGQSFQSGDVLLSIETDKAEIDVEAQDDGILGKILKQDGESNIPVGQPIAFLAEEGDDLSSIPDSAESSESSSASSQPQSQEQPQPSQEQATSKSADSPALSSSHHSHDLVKGLKPSVQRLLLSSSSLSESDIKSFLSRQSRPTKGDVLALIGQIKSSEGSLTAEARKKMSMSPFDADGKPKDVASAGGQGQKKAEPETPLDAQGLRRLIIQGMAIKAAPKPAASQTVGKPAGTEHDYDELFSSYLPPSPAKTADKIASQLAKKSRIAPLPGKDPLNDLFV